MIYGGSVLSSMSSDGVTVKQEPVWEGAVECVGESARRRMYADHVVKEELEGLYADHVIKEELVIGPEMLQACGSVFTSDASINQSKIETVTQETKPERLCSVVVERIVIDPEHRTCRAGLHTYKLSLCSQSPGLIHEKKVNKSRKENKKRHRQKYLRIRSSKNQSSVEGNLKYEEKVTAEGQQASVRRHACSATVADVAEQLGTENRETIPYKCGHCSYASAIKANVAVHERKHTGTRPFKCSYCSYACAQRGGLTRHERIHTGEKPYACRYCSYAGARKCHLQIHVTKHTGEKPYKCNQCSFASATKSYLLVHGKKHSSEKPYKCSNCSYACALKSRLQTHKKIHAGVKPFKCRYCIYATSCPSHLRVHERVHTGAKPYKCSQCSYVTPRKCNLVIHERKHDDE